MLVQLGQKSKRHLKLRGQFLLNTQDLSFPERLKISFSKHAHDAADRVIQKRFMRKDSEGQRFFEMSGDRIYFDGDLLISDQKYFLSGISFLSAETYCFPYIEKPPMVSLKRNDVVLDLGACLGTISLLMSRKVGPEGKIYAFEPVMGSMVEKNLKANGIENVEVIKKAVGEKAGQIAIEVSDFVLDSSIAQRDYTKKTGTYSKKLNVELISVDEFASKKKLDRIDFIKMDIEGAEELALRGAEMVIKKFKPAWSISSYHIDFDNEPQHEKLVRFLRDRGYQISQEKDCHIFAW